MGALQSLRDGDWPGVRQNFNTLAQLLGLVTQDSDGFGFTVAGVGVRFGTFSGTTSAAGDVVIPITHGLGKTPAAAFMSSNSSSGTQITVRAITPTSTTISAYVVRSAAAAVAVSGYWLVIG